MPSLPFLTLHRTSRRLHIIVYFAITTVAEGVEVPDDLPFHTEELGGSLSGLSLTVEAIVNVDDEDDAALLP